MSGGNVTPLPGVPAPTGEEKHAPILNERLRLVWLMGALQETILKSSPAAPARLGAVRQYDELAGRLAALDEAEAENLTPEQAYAQWTDELPGLPLRWLEAAAVHYCETNGLRIVSKDDQQ